MDAALSVYIPDRRRAFPSAPDAIYLPGPVVSALPERVETPIFEYGNRRLAQFAPDTRTQVLGAVEHLIDAALLFLTGEANVGTFTTANTAFFRERQAIRSGRSQRSRRAPVRRIACGPEPLPNFHEAARLQAALRRILGIDADVSASTVEIGDYEYTLKP